MTLKVVPWSYINQQYRRFGFEEDINSRSFWPVVFHQVDLSIVNALRRICVSEVPTFAFAPEGIQIRGVSQYHREVLLDRLGFIILNLEMIRERKINPKELVFMLCSKEDPGQSIKNTSTQILKITCHQHMRVFKGKDELPIQDICPYDSLLMTLRPNEDTHVVLVPSLGIGKQHPRWNSSITMYKFETLYDQQPILPESPQPIPEQQQYIGVEHKKPQGIILTIESIGKMYSQQVLIESIRVLISKLRQVREEIFNPDSKMVIIEYDPTISNLVKMKLINEDHTLGHVLEHGCTARFQRLLEETQLDAEEAFQLLLESMIMYRRIHPLDSFVELVVRVPIRPLKYTSSSTTSTTFGSRFPGGVPMPVMLVEMGIDYLLEICRRLESDAQELKSK